MKKTFTCRLVTLALGALLLFGAAFAVFSWQQALHLPPMLFTAGTRVFTAQSSLRLYDDRGSLLATQAVNFPVTTRPIGVDRCATIGFDRNSLWVEDSLGHRIFRHALTGMGNVTVKSSFAGSKDKYGLWSAFPMSSQISLGEGIKPATPHAYTLLIVPNPASKML